MGRPPIGERAMTDAERKRRQRALLRDSQPVPKPASRELAALAQELAQAKVDIRDLKDVNAALRGALAHERKRYAAKAKRARRSK